MSVTNGYCTAADLKAALPVSGSGDDALLDIAINAASRMVDGWCGWRFWQDDTVQTRTYRPDSLRCCVVPEGISTTTGLVVKLDEDGDGAFETTLTIATDFILEPLNAQQDTPLRPYDEIWLADNYTFPVLGNGRPGVQVTAKFGWPAVPDDVKAATILLSRDLFKEIKDAPFGMAGGNDFGPLRIRENRTAMNLLRRYRKPAVG